jgi:hypothetical protein
MQGGSTLLLRATLHAALEGVTDGAKRKLINTLERDVEARDALLESDTETSPETSAALLFFLTEHLDVLQAAPADKKDVVVEGLLRVYDLTRKKGAFVGHLSRLPLQCGNI